LKDALFFAFYWKMHDAMYVRHWSHSRLVWVVRSLYLMKRIVLDIVVL